MIKILLKLNFTIIDIHNFSITNLVLNYNFCFHKIVLKSVCKNICFIKKGINYV